MPETPTRSLGPTGWAVYLGCSWTWCIGMFLPALLIRDLGLWGYVVFAVPNVVGAAAMGWVLKSPESSRRLVEDHRQAAVLFSRVTKLFHVYWLVGFGSLAILAMNLAFWVLVPVMVIASLPYTLIEVFRSSDRGVQISALIVWLLSASLLASLAFSGSVSPDVSAVLNAVPFSPDVLWLLPASVFGFALCPYLDLTFHRARQSSLTTPSSRTAFGLGFGVFFFSMIVLTVLYTGPVASLMGGPYNAEAAIAPWAAVILSMHFILQSIFTYLVHDHELVKSGAIIEGKYGWWDIAFAFTPLIAVILFASGAKGYFGMSAGELGYRAFLTFYGLIFPTYVYLNVWNIRGRCLRTRTPRSLRVTVAAIVLASPFFFMGFFVRDERYIPAGVAILLLAKLFTGRGATGCSQPVSCAADPGARLAEDGQAVAPIS